MTYTLPEINPSAWRRTSSIEMLETPAGYFVRDSPHGEWMLVDEKPQRLVDGTVGYLVRWPRADDCFTAALATTLQVPISDVPDPRIDERLKAGETPEEINQSASDELTRWLAHRNLRMVVHRTVPVARRRWIGVIPFPGHFQSHCLVMDRGRVLFDPANDRRQPRTTPRSIRIFRAEDVRFGLSFRAAHQPHPPHPPPKEP